MNEEFTVVHGSPERLSGIRKSYEQIMMAVEFELRRILRAIGADITPETTKEQMQRQLEIMGIEIVHVNFEKSPEYSGWHIFQHKQPVMILCDPRPDPKDKGKIVLERKIPRDVQ